jgi:hypothetical protein
MYVITSQEIHLRREKNVAVNIVITTDEVAALYVPP